MNNTDGIEYTGSIKEVAVSYIIITISIKAKDVEADNINIEWEEDINVTDKW